MHNKKYIYNKHTHTPRSHTTTPTWKKNEWMNGMEMEWKWKWRMEMRMNLWMKKNGKNGSENEIKEVLYNTHAYSFS